MLRVKVQSCKWECLLCSRTFSTKFCYALHCKNVHGKCHEDSIIDSSCIIENRPPYSSTDIESPSDGGNTCSLKRDSKSIDEKQISSNNQNGKEEHQSGVEKTMSCEVCKRTFSSDERLNSHKTLHVVPASNRSLTSNSGKGSKVKKAKLRREKARSRGDDCRNELSSNHEQKDDIEKENHLEDKQSGNLKAQKFMNDDHFYATPVPESHGINEQNDSITSLDPIQLQDTADVKDGSRNNCKFIENTLVPVENETAPMAVAYPKRRGRPRKDQTIAVIMPKVAAANESGNNDIGQGIVLPCPGEEEKEARKCGPRKKTRECDVCHKVFANRSSLREHRRIHTGEKPFICAVCDKGFIRMGHLKQHMCSHTGLWPFKCGACGKGFMNPSRVTRHMRVHNDERPNVCDQCGESFKEPHHLARHMHLHSGVKPYKCPICEDRFFIQSGNLKIHMKTHEGEISESNVTLDEISHEIVASTSQLRDDNAPTVATTQEVTLEGIIAVSEGDIQGIDSTKENSEFNTDAENASAIESSKADDVGTISEIVLQIVPGAEHNVQVHGLQELASIDQELLRQFATSVAHELAQSEQAT